MNQKRSVLIAAGVVVAVAATLAIKRQPADADRAPVSATASSTQPIPRLVDLGAGKCVPCRMMAPILEELRSEYAGQFEVIFYDIWKDPRPGEQHGVRVIPTQIFFDAEGKELFRHEGFFSKEDILGTWKKLGFTLHPAERN
jgi:thioredoxin 1